MNERSISSVRRRKTKKVSLWREKKSVGGVVTTPTVAPPLPPPSSFLPFPFHFLGVSLPPSLLLGRSAKCRDRSDPERDRPQPIYSVGTFRKGGWVARPTPVSVYNRHDSQNNRIEERKSKEIVKAKCRLTELEGERENEWKFLL